MFYHDLSFAVVTVTLAHDIYLCYPLRMFNPGFSFVLVIVTLANDIYLCYPLGRFNPGLGDLDVVCEEFLEGSEIDCDFLLSPDDGSIVYNAICDDGYVALSGI